MRSVSDQPFDFLFATWEGGGSVPPVLSVASRLVARGHRVRVMSDACNEPETRAAGAEFVPWREAPSRPDKSAATDVIRDFEVGTPEEVIARLRERIMCGPALAYARDLSAELDRRPADLVVSSEMLLGAIAAAESRRQPLALLACNIPLFPVKGIPPFGPGLMPATSDEERALHAEIAAGSRAMFNLGLPSLNAARAALGLGPLDNLFDQLNAADRILLATAKAFDFPAEELPGHIRYVGPQIGEAPWAEPWASPWPAEDRRPLVLVSFSTSFQDQAASLQRVIDAVGSLSVRGLVTLGPALSESEMRGADNVVLRRTAPHNQVMRQAAIVVTHCGHGTVSRALAQGVPLLCMPMGRDQNDNAARVVARGAGLALAPDASSAEIANALQRLLNEPAFRAAAGRLGAQVAAEAASPAVIDELEELAAGQRRMRHAA